MSPLVTFDLSTKVSKLLLFIFLIQIHFIGVSHAQNFQSELNKSEAGKAILSLNPRILTDEVRAEIRNGSFQPVADRTSEANQVIDTLVRIKGKNPVFLGEAGVGKTDVIEKVARSTAQKNFFAKLVQDEILEAQGKARNFLTQNQGLVRFLVSQLIKNQSLTGEEFEVLVRYYKRQSLNSGQKQILEQRFKRNESIAPRSRQPMNSCQALFFR